MFFVPNPPPISYFLFVEVAIILESVFFMFVDSYINGRLIISILRMRNLRLWEIK